MKEAVLTILEVLGVRKGRARHHGEPDLLKGLALDARPL